MRETRSIYGFKLVLVLLVWLNFVGFSSNTFVRVNVRVTRRIKESRGFLMVVQAVSIVNPPGFAARHYSTSAFNPTLTLEEEDDE